MSEKKRIRCEIWSRCVGYMRPIRNWNVGKRQEFADRKIYDVRRIVANAIEAAEVSE